MEKSTKYSLVKCVLVIIGVSTALLLLSSCKEPTRSFQAPLFETIGDYRMEVTTTSEDARHFFDQGMIFTYGFNHGEAARSFREAIRLDSNFVMAYWGLAYTLGPNYNAPLDLSMKDEISWAVNKAASLKHSASEIEKGLVDAVELKYIANIDEPQLDSFANAMKELCESYPDNSDVWTFYAEALLLQHPWDLYDYKGGPAKDWTPRIKKALATALEINPKHPLANHLNIHATEAANWPEAGMNSAEELRKLIIPGAGHLVHMPSHTYINTGDYHLGTLVNLDAVKADSVYSAQCEAQGAFPLYYYHNYHFLAACAALEGRGALAIEASYKMTQTIDKTLLAKPGFETTQHFMTIPYNVMVKFAQWEKILATSTPDMRYPYLTALWHYARGMAYANLNQLTNASKELQNLNHIQDGAGFDEFLIFGINSGQTVIDIAMRVLEAEIAQKRFDFSRAQNLLLEAAEIEDSMSYNEPPDWFFSVRHVLGDLYMQQGMYAEAEQVYKQDLKNFPRNGFALSGLYHSLIGQGKDSEAKKARQRFEIAWSFADTKLKFSRVDEEFRTDLALKVSNESPAEIMRLSASFCGILIK
ncbi:tetratricopeptide repeat protein [Ekhidna sp. To15]|uniref:tetratricopeptide repeat protein n=1 Tax=Ekhidna sp. To15 TaxID=3395267 RepID=UPI003F51D233